MACLAKPKGTHNKGFLFEYKQGNALKALKHLNLQFYKHLES